MKTRFTILLLCAFTLAVRAQDAVTTMAGMAQVSGATNGTGTNALFGDPAGIVADSTGNLFVADSLNDVIRKITTNGVVTTFAGLAGITGTADGTGSGARFNAPSGMAFGRNGNLYVSDTGNNTIRKITPAGVVSTFAGVAGNGGYADGTAGSALFNSPLGLAITTNGTVYVADSGNHCLRMVFGGNVTTFAGSPQVWGSANGAGTNAQFNGPVSVAFDARGNLFVSDANNDTIRKVTTNAIVTTFAGAPGQDGSADGPVAAARFRSPAGLAFDLQGNLFIADSFNQTLREISTNGSVTPVSGTAGISGPTDGINGAGKFFNPYGLVMAADGSLLVADTYNETIRQVLVPFKLSLSTGGTAHTTTISWATVIGQTYQVQSSSNLTAGWANLGAAMVATNLTLSITDSSAGASRLYRVLRVD